METLRAVLEVGFVFWGVFALFLLIVLAYAAWMVRVERREEPPPPAAGEAP